MKKTGMIVTSILLFSFLSAVVVAWAQNELTVDATQQLAPPARGRGPRPGSDTPGHSSGLPIRLDLVVPTGDLTPKGTALIDFRITNIGTEVINLPIAIDQGSFLAQPPATDFTLDVLTLWLTSDAIRDGYWEVKGPDGQVHGVKTESPATSAELYGHGDDPRTFCALAPNQSIIVHASSRVALQPGTHSITAHAELAREFIGSNNTSPPSRHETSKLIGTGDSEPQIKMLSTPSPSAR